MMVLKISNINKNDIDFICYSSNFMHSKDHLQNISDWYNVGIDDQRRDKLQDAAYKKVVFEQRKTERINQVHDQLKCSSDKTFFIIILLFFIVLFIYFVYYIRC